MLTGKKRAYLELHIAILFYGLTGILGDLIQLSALLIVWWRVLLTSLSLLPFSKIKTLFTDIPRKMIWTYVGIGILVGLHWVTFYGSVKLSNVSICLVCMATTSFFTAFLEPILVKRPVRWYEILLSLLIVPGMFLVVDSIKVEMMDGVWVGLLSAFLAATFSTLNKKYIGESDPIRITFLELGSAWAFLSLVLITMWVGQQPIGQFFPPDLENWGYLFFMAIFCTSLAYVLTLRALHYVSAFMANLSINLEPVYGILLAWWLLNENEELSSQFYWGVVIILLAVFIYPFFEKWQARKELKLTEDQL